MSRSSASVLPIAGPSRAILLLAACAFAACGGGNGGAGTPISDPVAIGTLAYVTTELQQNSSGCFVGQTFFVRQGDRDPVRVFELPMAGPLGRACEGFAQIRSGVFAPFFFAIQRFSVSPDGAVVVFEVTDDFSIEAANRLIETEREGIYLAHADGSAVRKLGPASREPLFRYVLDPSSPLGILGTQLIPRFAFSPDSREIAFVDFGVGPAGEEALQIFTQDVASGERRQITHLPFDVSRFGADSAIRPPFYLDRDTIGFATAAAFGDLNPGRDQVVFTVDSDGSDFKLSASLSPITQPGAAIQPLFAVIGQGRVAGNFPVPGVPENPPGVITEVAVTDGTAILQVTNFRRVDTGRSGWFLSPDGRRVFFAASGDPFGTNPGFNCQLFSVDALGGDLRQLTSFRASGQPAAACLAGPSPECRPTFQYDFVPSQDARTGTVVFGSNCDPAGGELSGDQLFAMAPDGSGLRQLTRARGLQREADGGFTLELTGFYSYGPYR